MKVLYVGADISKATFTGAYWAEGSQNLGSHENEEEGYKLFGQAVEERKEAEGAEQVHLVLEPTSGYELGLALYGYKKGWLVTKPNPWQVRKWAEGAGYRAKTDPVDARMLAEYGYRMEPEPQALLSQEVRELDYLLRRLDDRDQLLKMETNRLKSAQAIPDMPQAVLDDLEQAIASLQEQRAALAKTIKEHLNRFPELKKLYRQLLSVPGIGPKTVLPLMVLLYRFDALTNGQGNKKQLTAFLGLDSQVRQSGTSVWGQPSISKQGDRQARSRLYMSALGGIRGQNPLRQFYSLMVARGKAKKVALVASARKILHWAWAVFRSGEDFDPLRALPKGA